MPTAAEGRPVPGAAAARDGLRAVRRRRRRRVPGGRGPDRSAGPDPLVRRVVGPGARAPRTGRGRARCGHRRERPQRVLPGLELLPHRRSGRAGRSLDDRLVASHRHEVESFRRGADLLDLPPEPVEIPYAGTTLPGYFFRACADATPRRTLILVNGYDGSAEELYFTNGAAALARGYHVLAFDGPGQGTMLVDRGVPFRPDWEAVVTPVVDHLLSRPEVDAGRIALMGLELRRLPAPRAATAEHRIAACVSDCGPYDLLDASLRRLPGPMAKQIVGGTPRGRAVVAGLLDRIQARPSLGWALRRNRLVHQVDDPMAFFEIASDYSLRGREALITCPTFVCTTDRDDLSLGAVELYDALTCEKTYVQFKAADGAGEHCGERRPDALPRGRVRLARRGAVPPGAGTVLASAASRSHPSGCQGTPVEIRDWRAAVRATAASRRHWGTGPWEGDAAG